VHLSDTGETGLAAADPDVTVPLSGEIGYVNSYYAPLANGATCNPGAPELPDYPPLGVRSMAAASSYARALKEQYVDGGQEIQADPTHEDFGSGGLQPVTWDLEPTTAYVLRLADNEMGAYVEHGSSALVINGPFTKSDMQQIIDQLEPR
jgi:hypothetical protein